MIPVQKHFRLRDYRRENDLARWKLSMQRERWVYNVIAGCVLCLLAFVVAGVCK